MDLKRKYEALINEKEVIFKNNLSVKMTKCDHCKFHGHFSFTCPIRKHVPYKVRQVWVPKGTRDLVTKSQRSKAIWVPKIK